MGISLTLEARISRHPDTVAEQMVAGLVNGALLGAAQIIQRRERAAIAFRCERPLVHAVPEAGTIEVLKDEEATLVRVQMTCVALLLRAAGRGLVVGLFMGLGTWVSTRSWAATVSVGLALAGLSTAVCWRVTALRVAGRARSFLHNLNYLKAA